MFYGRYMRSTILFDLDGTLLDTSPGIFSTANQTMQELGLAHLSDAQLRKFVGPPLAACFRVACGLEEALIPQACAVYREIYANEGAMFQASIYPQILELLQQLDQRGFVMGVATLKSEPLAEDILEHFGIATYFKTIVGADSEGKLSKADIIGIALERLKQPNLSQVIMVGDTPHDLDGAVAIGVDFLGVDWGFGFSKGHAIPPQPYILGMIDEPLSLLDFL